MSSLRDGLGFDEVMQSGLAGPESNHAYFVGSVTSQSQFSGLNFFANGSFVGKHADANGLLNSASVGSPSVYGAFVQAGEGGPLLAATGSLVFGRAFSDSSYKLVITSQESGTLFWKVASGTGTYSTSGATVAGQSGLKFNWVAVGI